MDSAEDPSEASPPQAAPHIRLGPLALTQLLAEATEDAAHVTSSHIPVS